MHPRSSAALLGGAIATCALLALVPAPALAADGTYAVYACKGPTGAPVGVAGWSPAATPEAQATNGCSGGGPFAVALNANAHGGQGAGWSFAAPAGTRIAGLTALRVSQGFAGTANNSATYAITATGSAPDGNRKDLERCVKDGDACQTELTAPVSKPGLDAAGVTIGPTCGLSAFEVCPNPPTTVSIGQAVVSLKDDAKPVVGTNAILDEGETSGTLAVRFDATDQGGGLYRVNTLVDGRPFASEGLGGPDCVDADPADGDAHQFLVPQPCAAAVAGREVRVTYGQLPPGPHTVQTEVEDAAGNTQAVSAVQFPKVNGDGGPGSDFERLRHARIRAWFGSGKKHPREADVPYGERSVIRGKVVDRRGKGIAGARLDVYHVTRGGRRTLAKTGLKTRKQGLFTYIVSKKVDTRKIDLTYRATRPGPVTSDLRLSLRVVRKGKTFYLKQNRPKAAKKGARRS